MYGRRRVDHGAYIHRLWPAPERGDNYRVRIYTRLSDPFALLGMRAEA